MILPVYGLKTRIGFEKTFVLALVPGEHIYSFFIYRSLRIATFIDITNLITEVKSFQNLTSHIL